MLFNLVYEALGCHPQFFRDEDGAGDWEDVADWESEHGGVYATREELAKALVQLAPLIHRGEVKNLSIYMAD